jgi:CDP-diacylglycerol--glycerol-3-phosphate 3-phosphatidyltransferase
MQEVAPASRLVSVLPNALSWLRIALALSFPLLPPVPPGWRLGVVAAGGLSDWLDGVIARRYGVTSTSGGIIDAIADKLFVLSVLLTLTLGGALELWQAVLVLSRDLAVAAVVVHVLFRREWSAFRRMPARPLGRATTVAQFALLIAILLPWPAWGGVVAVTLTVAVLLSVLAAADYLLRFAQALREQS